MVRFVVPRVLAAADPSSLHDALRPLGLWRRRSATLVKFAQAWVLHPPQTAQELRLMPGCGNYACDSWSIFVEGKTDLSVSDGKLLWFLQQLREAQEAASPATSL
jgi:endonuclease III